MQKYKENLEQKKANIKTKRLQLATPKWFNKNNRNDGEVYTSLLNRAKAEGLELDYIIPLQNEFICGLHIKENWRLIAPQEKQKNKINLFLVMESLIEQAANLEEDKELALKKLEGLVEKLGEVESIVDEMDTARNNPFNLLQLLSKLKALLKKT